MRNSIRDELELTILVEMENCKTFDELIELKDELIELIYIQSQVISDSQFESKII